MRSLILLIITSFVFSQWSTNPEDPGVFIDYSLGEPNANSDGIGGISFMYHVDNSGNLNQPIVIQSVDRYGYIKWDEHVIIHGNLNNSNPWLVSGGHQENDGSGGLFVAYSLAIYNTPDIDPDNIYDFTEYLYVQHIDSNGIKLWGDFGVKVTYEESYSSGLSTWWIGLCKMVPDDNSGIYIIWSDWRDGYDSKPYGQRIDFEGNKYWDSTGIQLNYSDGDLAVLNAIPDSQGGLILQTRGNRYQRINTNGGLLWGNDGLQLITNNKGWGSLITDKNGGGYVIQKYMQVGQDSTDDWVEFTYNINRLSDNGTLLWGENGVSTGNYEKYASLKLATHFDGSVSYLFGSYIINYISTNGTNMWTNSFYPGLRNLNILVSDDNSVILTGHLLDDPTEYYIKKINSEGDLAWNGDSLFFTSREMVTDSRGGVISVNLVNCIQVNKNGEYGQVLLSSEYVNDYILNASFILGQNYPNPFNCYTRIHYEIFSPNEVKLSIYDIKGREIAVLVNGIQETGMKSVVFNAENIASGQYYYRLFVGSSILTKNMINIK